MEQEKTDFMDSNAYVTANDLVDGLCVRIDDTDRKYKPKFLFYLKEIFQHLNLNIIRQTERVLLKVNPALKCIDVPDGYLGFSSISAPNRHGKFEPLIINPDIPTDDVVDIGASKKCGCECGCACDYCSSVRNYELISSQVAAIMPGGGMQEFTGTIRKKILKDGSYVREVTMPTQIFNNNVHTDTILQTTTEHLCHLDVKECGCIKESPANERLLFECCDANTIYFDCGGPIRQLPPDSKFYKINQKGNRIHFPASFPYETVLLRFFGDTKTRQLRIPYLAQKVVRFGIMAEHTTFTSPGSRENLTWIRLYAKAQEDLAVDLTQLKSSDFYKHVLGTFRVL